MGLDLKSSAAVVDWVAGVLWEAVSGACWCLSEVANGNCGSILIPQMHCDMATERVQWGESSGEVPAAESTASSLAGNAGCLGIDVKAAVVEESAPAVVAAEVGVEVEVIGPVAGEIGLVAGEVEIVDWDVAEGRRARDQAWQTLACDLYSQQAEAQGKDYSDEVARQ